MDDQPRTDADRALHVQLEVDLDRQPISGRLRSERGADERFVGWLGFVEALKRLDELQRSSPEEERTTWPT
jgi:hypothetical protein